MNDFSNADLSSTQADYVRACSPAGNDCCGDRSEAFYGDVSSENLGSENNVPDYAHMSVVADLAPEQAQCSDGVCSLNWKPMRPAA